MSLILCSDVSPFLDNLKLSPVFTLSGTDFQDALGSPVDSFANLASALKGLLFPDTAIEVDVAVAVPRARVHVGQFAAPLAALPGPGDLTQANGSSRCK
jgi:hypothetical protein